MATTIAEKVKSRFQKSQPSSPSSHPKPERPVSMWSDSRSTISDSSSIVSGYYTGSVSSGVNSASSYANLPLSRCDSGEESPPVWTDNALYKLTSRKGGSASSSSDIAKPNSETARRLSSNTRFNEFIASTSSWDWDDGDDEEDFEDEEYENDSFEDLPDLSTSFVSSTRWKWSGSGRAGCKRQVQVDVCKEPDRIYENLETIQPKAVPGHSRAPCIPAASSTSARSEFERNKFMRASCPALDHIHPAKMLTRELKKKLKIEDKDLTVSKSAANLDKNLKGRQPGMKNKMSSSKSTGCIPSLDVPPIEFKFKKPITFRFAPSGLTESNKVVWLSENGDYSGKVQWVGKIRDIFHAGVEFDKPIGNSSGIYGYGHGLQIRLFTCKLGYGKFIPVDQLILYEDYYEDQKTGFICIICRDDFIEPGQHDGFDAADKIMVATRCGHLFHQTCLTQWFNEKAASFQQCPFCNLPMERNDTIRIFPAQCK